MRKLKHIVLVVLALTGSLPAAYALTEVQMRTEIRLRIKDTNSLRQRYSDTQILNLENEAQRDVINNTWAIHKSTSFVLVPNTTYYTLPSDVITLERVTLDKVLLPEATLIKLDSINEGGKWETTSGRPNTYFTDPTNPALIGFYPWPTVSTDTGTAKVFYYAYATDLVNTTDVPYNGISAFTPYSDLIIFYVAFRVYLVEGEADKATTYRQEYESRLQIMNSRIGARPNYIPGMSGPSTSR